LAKETRIEKIKEAIELDGEAPIMMTAENYKSLAEKH
jgi:hypothetical protein